MRRAFSSSCSIAAAVQRSGRRGRRHGRWVKAALDAEPNVEWLIAKAGRILVEHGRVVGIASEDGDSLACRALVITTGTFLNGLIHIGPEQYSAGRAGEPPSAALA